MRSMANQVREAHRERQHDDPGAIVRQEHEAEIAAALQRIRHLIGLPGRAVNVAEQALDDQRQAEGEQQPVERIELAQMLEKQPLDRRRRSAPTRIGAMTSAPQ